MSTIMIVLDGLQDIAYPELEGKTPYEAGKGENFALLEQASATGRFVSTPQGFEPDTQTCILALLGVPAAEIPGGRSYIEALAQGIPVGEDDIILRSNFVKVSADGRLEIPCCSAPKDVAEALLAAIRAEGHTVTPVGSYKSLQCIKHGRKYLEGMHTNLPHQHGGEMFEDLLPTGNLLADSLADFSRAMLDIHAPYTVLNWAQSVKSELPAFKDLHGISGAMVSKTDAPIGIAHAMGMECPPLPTATGDTDTDLAAKVAATLELARRHDFVMLHIGGPDEATHRQDAVEKAEFIKKLDAELLAPVLQGCEDGTVLLLTCDHAALCSTGGHTAEPVDFFLYEKGKQHSGDFGTMDGGAAVDFAAHGAWRTQIG